MTGSGHWQVMLTVTSPTWEPDSRSVPLMPGKSLTSPGCRSRLFTARPCSHTSVMRTCGLTEAGSDCQSVKISVLCEPCSWLCTPSGQPASSCGMCRFTRRTTRIPRNHFRWFQSSSSVQGPHCLFVSLPVVREGTQFVLPRGGEKGASVEGSCSHGPTAVTLARRDRQNIPSRGPHVQYF